MESPTKAASKSSSHLVCFSSQNKSTETTLPYLIVHVLPKIGVLEVYLQKKQQQATA